MHLNPINLFSGCDHLLNSIFFFYQFLTNYKALLLCKINDFDIFNMVKFFSDDSYIASY